jgi:hypothetical protein
MQRPSHNLKQFRAPVLDAIKQMNRSLFLLLIFLTGCIETQTVAIGPPPTHDQSVALVQEYVHKAFVDPHSIQDLTIEPPVQQGGRWVIYFSSNSKNRMGGYTGIQRSKLLLDKNNQIDWNAQQLEMVRENDQMPI